MAGWRDAPVRTEGFFLHDLYYLWYSYLFFVLYLVSNAFSSVTYSVMPLASLSLVRRWRKVTFHWLFFLLGLFIFTCGVTLFLEIWTLRSSASEFISGIKVLTGFASVTTALLLVPLIFQAVTLHRSAQRGRDSCALQNEIAQRRRAEDALRRAHEELEHRVHERTAMLIHTNLALQQTNEELQQFAYTVAHDLQEPLRMVRNYVELLAKRYQGQFDAEGEEFIRYAVDGAARAQQLVTDLLAYTRVDSPVQEMAPVDCEALLARILKDLRLAIADSGAEVTCAPLPLVHGNVTRLGQVFQNLLSNALKFSGEAPPRIHISATQEGPHWVFAVRDNGIGLDPTHAERIFGLFQRVHSRQQYPGSGMGLAICKKIIEQHGGRIWVESEPGKGSTFYFTLPA